MIALIQRTVVLGVLALTGLAAVMLWRTGQSAWAALVPLAVMVGHAAVLALEFGLMALAHRDDPTPRPTPQQRVRAWWGETRAATRVFFWRQPFASRRWPDRVDGPLHRRRGVLLVHGFFCNRGLWNRWLHRLHAQGTPVVAVNLEPVFGSIDDYVPLIEAAVQKLERATGLPPIAVAHSMGGLAVRRWWAEQGPGERLHRALTLGTPHRGTWMARLAMTNNGRQMRLQGDWLTALSGRDRAERAARTVCFYSHCDNIVFPPTTATLPGADNRHLPAVAHVAMVDDAKEPWDELQRLLADPPDTVAMPAAAATEVVSLARSSDENLPDV